MVGIRTFVQGGSAPSVMTVKATVRSAPMVDAQSRGELCVDTEHAESAGRIVPMASMLDITYIALRPLATLHLAATG
jgi:hypothetical protein